MLHVFWLPVKYTLNVVQNTLIYIKCIGTPQKVTKLQPKFWLHEQKRLIHGWNIKEVIQYGRMYNLIVSPQSQKY